MNGNRDSLPNKDDQWFDSAARAIVANLDDPIVVLDLDSRVRYLNPAFESRSGVALDSVLGLPVEDVPALAGGTLPAEPRVQEALAQRGSWRGSTSAQTADGVRQLECTITGLSAGTEHIGYLLAFHDITARIEALHSLEMTEERYQSLIEQTPSVTYLDSPKSAYRWLYVSPQIEQMTGFRADEWMAEPDLWEQVVHPEDHDWVNELDATTNITGQAWSVDYRMVTRDGRTIWVHDSATVVMGDDGEASLWQGTFTDITWRKEIEESLSFQAHILENINDAIIATDHELRFTSWNRAAELTYGWTAAEVLGRPMHEVLRTELLDTEMSDEILDLAETGQWKGQLIQYHRSGRPLFIDAKGLPLLDDRGIIVGHVTVNRDVTERHRAEEIARTASASEAVAAQANRAKSDFLSRMSHELRTPLNAVLGFAQLLSLEENATEDQQRSVQHILRGGNHLLTLIDDVLDISRVEVDQLGLSPQPIQASAVVAEAVDLVGMMAQERGIQIIWDASETEEPEAEADPQRLKQVLLNLLTNAVKYNREGGEVRLSQHRRDDAIRIEVADDGPGLSAEEVQRAFQPFERLGAELTEVEGTGLGLALSKRLVEAMGGKIGAKNRPEGGCTFWFTLPLSHADRLSKPPRDVDAMPILTGDATGRVLYIEDNPSNLRLVQSVLRRRPDIEMLSATDGRTGLDLALRTEPDLILLDIHLPDLPGTELLPMLRADPKTAETPILIVSADATADRMDAMMEAGATGYLTKPLDVVQFLAILDKLLAPSPASS